MKKRALLALLVAAMMLLSGCALIVKDEQVDMAREIIRVGDIVYTKAEVLEQVDYSLYYMQWMYSMYGMQYDVTDPAIIAETQEGVVGSMVEEAVLILKARELGLDQFTDEENEAITQAATATWQDYRDAIQAELALPEGTPAEEVEAAIDAVCASEEMTLDVVIESEQLKVMNEKLQAWAIRDVVVTDEDVAASFNAEVEAARAAYQEDPSAYGAAVLNGETVYYRPAGYRMVRQILIATTEEDEALIEAIKAAREAAVTEQNAVATALAYDEVMMMDALVDQVHVELAEVTEPTAEATVLSVTNTFAEDLAPETADRIIRLAQAMALRSFYERQLEMAQAQAMANIAVTADEVLARLEAGEDWDALAAEYNSDPGMTEGAEFAVTGYPVCAGFDQFDEAFVNAAMAIDEVGAWSDKTEGAYGYYIIQYTADVVEGPVDMAPMAETLRSELLAAEQDAVYNAAVQQWVSEADVKIDMKALND